MAFVKEIMSDRKRLQILEQAKQGLSRRAISRNLKVSEKTVRRVLATENTRAAERRQSPYCAGDVETRGDGPGPVTGAVTSSLPGCGAALSPGVTFRVVAPLSAMAERSSAATAARPSILPLTEPMTPPINPETPRPIVMAATPISNGRAQERFP
jgi:hypothetical protein